LLGPIGSAESKAEYGRVIRQWEAVQRRLADTDTNDLTINELILAYWPFVKQHYRRADGSATNEQNDIKYSLKPLKELFGRLVVSDFGPLKLKAVRQQMITNGLARPVINKRISRIRRLFKWGVENELVTPTILHGLQAVSGLQRGRTEAREPEPVRPVASGTIDATLPFMPPPVAALVHLQLLTAARPGELVTVRTADLNTAGTVWVFTPLQHKTAYRGRGREIYLGPKAQVILRPWLKTELEAFVFSPIEAEQARNAAKRAGRRTKLWPSHLRRKEKLRRRATHGRRPSDRYTTSSYARAVARACDRAFPPPEPLAKRPDEKTAEWKERLTPEQH
jgi:hypothetical protein